MISNETYSGPTKDTNWFIFSAEEDEVYPPYLGQEIYTSFFAANDMSDQLRYDVIVEDMGHYYDPAFTMVMMDWVKNGTVTSVEDYFEHPDWAWYYEEDDSFWGEFGDTVEWESLWDSLDATRTVAASFMATSVTLAAIAM
jgi:hypothetical protein